MKITMTSEFTGKSHTLDLPITTEQYKAYLNDSRPIQESLPQLSPDQREFLITGATKEEWDELFKEEDRGDQDLRTNDE